MNKLWDHLNPLTQLNPLHILDKLGNQSFPQMNKMDVQKYIQQVMQQSLPFTSELEEIPFMKNDGKLPYTSYETLDHVIVQINLPQDIDASQLQFSLGNNLLVMEGISGHSRQDIPLSHPICKTQELKAKVKDQILEIYLPKQTSKSLKQVKIRFL
jgi:HSP20 family molecular chaperone IbpA